MMWRMLQAPQPHDYVAATGEAHSVREFVQDASRIAGFEIEWDGEGVAEIGRDRKTGNVLVEIDPRFYRPAEVDLLIGDATKARNELCWEPTVRYQHLVEIMMKADLEYVVNYRGDM